MSIGRSTSKKVKYWCHFCGVEIVNDRVEYVGKEIELSYANGFEGSFHMFHMHRPQIEEFALRHWIRQVQTY